MAKYLVKKVKNTVNKSFVRRDITIKNYKIF